MMKHLVKVRKDNQGFTLVELMIVVAIIGILAAIAVPQYLSYIANSKLTACNANYDIAQTFVKSELAKRAQFATTGAGASATKTAIADLNSGGKKDPYTAAPAFATAATGANTCTTLITPATADDLTNPAVGTKVTVTAGQMATVAGATTDVTVE